MQGSNVLMLETLLYEKNLKVRESGDRSSDDYKEIRDKITQSITDNHSSELAEGLYSVETESRIKNLINRYLLSEKLVQNATSIGNLTERLYEDMAGVGFLKKYLDDPEVEEININSWRCIMIVYKDRKIKAPESFMSPEDCINVVKKLARMGGLILDGSTPYGDSYISKGVRMTAQIAPVVGDEIGAAASIRKQRPSYITKEKLIEFDTTTAEELDFLTLCLNNGQSVAIAGATGSGKTADINYLLNAVDKGIRVITIEDTKELQPQNADLVQLYTQEPPKAVTMDNLLTSSLRMHPKMLVPAEMRGVEAKTAVEAARTGHISLTSLHANGAQNAYGRILTMYRQADAALSEDIILRMIIEAFPIMVYKEQLPDNSRRYIEIFEATDVENGKVIGNTIFEFRPTKTDRENGKTIRIHGEHVRIGNISERLALAFLRKGVDSEIVEQYREAN